MLSWVEHEKSFITLGSDCITLKNATVYYAAWCYLQLSTLRQNKDLEVHKNGDSIILK